MATPSSILAWRTPWTEEPGRLQSMQSQESWTWPSNWASCTQPQSSSVKPPPLKWRSDISNFSPKTECSQSHRVSLLWLLLLLSCFSHVWLCATPQTAAHQAPPSLGFSSKNTGVGCHFLLQCMKVKSESEVAQLYPTLSHPMDCSLRVSSVHGIFPGKSTGVGCHCLLHLYG